MTTTEPTVNSEEDMERRVELTAKGMGLAWWAERQPDKTAILSPTANRTFAELNENANRLVRALRARGLTAGDAVAVLCTNRPAFAEAVAACQRGGFRMTPINWHLTGEEAAYIVADCEARAVVADARLAELSRSAVERVDGVVARLAAGGAIEGFESYEEALAAEAGDDIDDPTPGGQMLYTSGTTGRPKGVYRPPAPIATNAAMIRMGNIYGYAEPGGAPGEGGTTPGDLHLCTGPLYHAAPLAFSLAAPLAYGCGVVLMEKWDAEEALRLIDAHRITHTHMVPTMFHRLISLPPETKAKYDVSSMRYILHGAAPCPVEVKRALIEWFGPVVWEYYAATEGVGSFVDSATWLSRPGTVGKPMMADQVKIGDDRGEPMKAGEVGLVYIKAPATGRFAYFKDEAKTESAYRGEYFTLGDMGYVDEDGFLFLTDRTANLIISGGVNIYPAEVDAVLLQHPAVGDVATIGIPNPEWGEEVKAVVELQPGFDATDDLARELLGFCRGKLAGYKCPRTLDFIDELPRQDNGKIYKRLLRDRYREQAASTSEQGST